MNDDLIDILKQIWFGMPRFKLKEDYKSEDAICMDFGDELRSLYKKGKIKAFFTHVANENPHKGFAWNNKRRIMGKNAGTSDYIFMEAGNNLCLEFKVRGKTLSKNQKLVRAWCNIAGVPYKTVFSKNEGLAMLKEYGFLKK